MKIYIGHASSFDYHNDLYAPIKESNLSDQYDFVFPHELNAQGQYSRDIIMSCSGMIAEVSHASTGLGIELTWAQNVNIPIFCVAKSGSKPSSALNQIGADISLYEDTTELLNNLRAFLMTLKVSQ